MNYLTNHYRNLCEQLQEKINFLESNYYKNLCENLQGQINILEAQIYGAEGKFMKGSEKLDRIFSALSQGEKRKTDVESLKAALADKSHPIHQNPEHVEHIQRVVADIERLTDKIPGDPTQSELAQHAVGEKESPVAVKTQEEIKDAMRRRGVPEEKLPTESAFPSFGWAMGRPQVGRATAQHMRTAIDVMRGTYGKTTPTTGSQQY